MAFDASLWGQQATHTINVGQVPSSQSNVPILITKNLASFPSSMLDGGPTSALNGGGDIRVSTDTAGSNQLPVEIVSCVTSATPSSQELIMWVLVPTVNDSEVIYITWNKAGESQPPVTDPFGRNAVWADYLAVLHINSTAWTDSTGNSRDGVATGSPTITSTNHPFGGNWAEFDRSLAERLTLNNTANILDNLLGGTVKAVIYRNSNHTGGIVSNRNSSKGNNWQQLSSFGASNGYNCNIHDGTGESSPATTAGTLGLSFVTQTWNTTNNFLYVDSSQKINASMAGDGELVSNIPIYVGSYFSLASSFSFDGSIGEVWIKASQDSADKVATEYNNQSNQSAWATIGTPYPPSGGGINITPTSVGSTWTTNNYTVDLTGSIDITPQSVGSTWAANNYFIDLTGEIAVTPQPANTTWAANNYNIQLSAGIEITPQPANTAWTANNYDIQLSGVISLTPATVNQEWSVNNYTVTLSSVVINGKHVRRVNAKIKNVRIGAKSKIKRFN